MVYEVTTGPRLASPVSTVVVETCHPKVTLSLLSCRLRSAGISRGAVGRAQHKPERHRLGQRTSPDDYSDGSKLDLHQPADPAKGGRAPADTRESLDDPAAPEQEGLRMNSGLTAQDVMLAAALIFGIATACQVVAPKLRVPALVLLLPAGFLFWARRPAVARGCDPGTGPSRAVVDLIVAVILFQGGMGLTAIRLPTRIRVLVRRLIGVGAPVTGVAATLAAHVLLGLDWPIAVMLGTILIVSGPTVLNPILDFAQPNARVRDPHLGGHHLDPIGALIAVVAFQIVKASSSTSPAEAVVLFLTGVLVALVAAAIGVVIFVVGGLLARGNKTLGTQVLLGSVIVTAGLANSITDDSGLLAALIMGITAPRLARRFRSVAQ